MDDRAGLSLLELVPPKDFLGEPKVVSLLQAGEGEDPPHLYQN